MKPAMAGGSGTTPGVVGDERLRVGTLQYTKAGLVQLFIWLLWGDLIFQLMESVAPNVVPLLFKDLGVSDFWLPILMTTIPQIINTGLNPFISTASDRYRGRLGRRIPFLLYSAPFISGCLVLIAFYPEIGAAAFEAIGPLTGVGQTTVVIITLAVVWIMFTLLNMFATTTFYYLFNDVVPGPFMARFFGFFRAISGVAAILWNEYVYPYSTSHTQIIFLVAAGVYFVGFVAMCMRVKEGQYPPPKPTPGFWKKFASYFGECLSHRLFRYMFIHEMFWMASSACQTYFVFFQRDSLGLNLTQIGQVLVWVNAVSLVLSYPAGMLGDRFHPMKIMVWIKIGMVLMVPIEFIWLFWSPPPEQAVYVLIAMNIVSLPLVLLYETARQPMQMLVWPKSRYGQFCSFNAIARATAGAVAGVLAGGFMWSMRQMMPDDEWGKDFCYRMSPVWKLPFLCCGLIMLAMIYREWKRLGGQHHYKVPGFEHEESAAAAVVAATDLEKEECATPGK
jgi:Na+/melibiose symporter-like transporter